MRRMHPLALLSLALLFLIGALSAGIAVAWRTDVLAPSATITMPQRMSRPPLPLPRAATQSLAYDTRPCRAHPSPQTCDGKLPRVAWDAQVAAGQDGNEACLDGERQTLKEQPLDALHPERGTLTLFWLPPCHAFYAQVESLQAVLEMSITISSQETHRSFSSSERFAGESEVNLLTSPLLFGDRREPIKVSGHLTERSGSALSFSLEAQTP